MDDIRRQQERRQEVFLCLGSNQGERERLLEQACNLISQRIGGIRKKSLVYETTPWKMENTELFLNQVIQVDTVWTAMRLLRGIQRVETELGRFKVQGSQKYASRPIDIDILFYGKEVIRTKALIVPHPLIAQRRFVLAPLAEVAGEWVHPVTGESVSTILRQCSDNQEVRVYSPR